MKMFIFIVAIPVIAGATTAAYGIYFFNPETANMAMAINIPICILSAVVYAFTD